MITRRRFTQIAAAGPLCWAGRSSAAEKTTLPKRGCCFVTREGNGWKSKVEQLKPSWMYTWGAKQPAELPAGVDFTPMLWGDAQSVRQQERIADLKQRAKACEVRHLLAFNEPDQHEQANMTIDRVVELWPELMDIGVPLVSPGCVHPDKVWMNGFMEEVERKRLRVDAVAVHSYMGPSVEIFIRRMESVYKAFGRPLWITEFAVGDWKAKTRAENKHSPEQILSFMRELLPALDELPFVHRYAWFSASPSSGPLGTSALLDDSGDLTPLGELYASHSG